MAIQQGGSFSSVFGQQQPQQQGGPFGGNTGQSAGLTSFIPILSAFTKRSKQAQAIAAQGLPPAVMPVQQLDPITAALQAGAGLNPQAGRMKMQSRLRMLSAGFKV